MRELYQMILVATIQHMIRLLCAITSFVLAKWKGEVVDVSVRVRKKDDLLLTKLSNLKFVTVKKATRVHL